MSEGLGITAHDPSSDKGLAAAKRAGKDMTSNPKPHCCSDVLGLVIDEEALVRRRFCGCDCGVESLFAWLGEAQFEGNQLHIEISQLRVKVSNGLEVVAVNVREQDEAISVPEFTNQWREVRHGRAVGLKPDLVKRLERCSISKLGDQPFMNLFECGSSFNQGRCRWQSVEGSIGGLWLTTIGCNLPVQDAFIELSYDSKEVEDESAGFGLHGVVFLGLGRQKGVECDA